MIRKSKTAHPGAPFLLNIETPALAAVPKENVANVPSILDSAVRLEAIDNSTIKARVDTNRAAVFILSDAWYPDWRAFANGSEIYVGRVNEAFRGIVVPAGVTQLELRYEPRTLHIAKVLSCLSLGLILLVALAHRRINNLLRKLYKN